MQMTNGFELSASDAIMYARIKFDLDHCAESFRFAVAQNLSTEIIEEKITEYCTLFFVHAISARILFENYTNVKTLPEHFIFNYEQKKVEF